ncbi:hypothetical protein FRC12_023068 [Ceratobasidium sp. 428]|nr:hypothetical protein FRC12_023068 [Ceratobasidium sp. 428]
MNQFIMVHVSPSSTCQPFVCPLELRIETDAEGNECVDIARLSADIQVEIVGPGMPPEHDVVLLRMPNNESKVLLQNNGTVWEPTIKSFGLFYVPINPPFELHVVSREEGMLGASGLQRQKYIA